MPEKLPDVPQPDRYPAVPQPYVYPPPLPPEITDELRRGPTQASIARTQWEMDNAPRRSAADYARIWVNSYVAVDPSAAEGLFEGNTDAIVFGQLVLTDAYDRLKDGSVADEAGDRVANNAWLLSRLHNTWQSTVSSETLGSAELVGERWVNRMWQEALRDNQEHDEAAAQEAEQQRLREVASHDPLTGLYSRLGWIEQTLRRGEGGDPLIVIQLDVDLFKAVNDLCGHARGDEVLRALGRILGSNSRETDIVARVSGTLSEPYEGTDESVAGRSGGDEYVIALNPSSQQDPAPDESTTAEEVKSRRGHVAYDPLEQAQSYIERIRQSFQAWLDLPTNEDIRALGLGLSAGINVWNGGQRLGRRELEECVMRADIDMYYNKEQRRQERLGEFTPKRIAQVRSGLASLEAGLEHPIDPRILDLLGIPLALWRDDEDRS